MPRAISEQTEDWVENYLVEQCTMRGALCVKVQKRRGWPDRHILWFFGVHDEIETKRPKGGKYEPLQLRTHAKIRERGHSVFVINTRVQVDEYIASRTTCTRAAYLANKRVK